MSSDGAGVPARTALVAGLAVIVVGAFLVRGSTDWLYQLQHRGGLASAAAFQEWARTQTPVDSVFLILPSEPNNDDFYMNADRALYLVRERANQAVYFPSHNQEFRARVEGLGVSNVLRYREELDQAYRRLTEERIRELAAELQGDPLRACPGRRLQLPGRLPGGRLDRLSGRRWSVSRRAYAAGRSRESIRLDQESVD